MTMVIMGMVRIVSSLETEKDDEKRADKVNINVGLRGASAGKIRSISGKHFF